MPDSQSFSGRVRNFANLSKPDIQINLRDDSNSGRNYINSFTTSDKIEGALTISAPYDIRYEQLEISLVGSVKCYVDRVGPSAAISARSEAFQMFLKMDYPCHSSDLPEDGLLKADQTYEIPFDFTVPGSLPGSCKHKTVTDQIKEMHLQLPPSLGDPEVSGRGSQLMDDCAPDMCRVSYAVRARLTKLRESDNKQVIISDRSRKVRIIPAYEEQPPISIDESDEDYCLREEKSVRKGLLKAKHGKLVMEASQPKSLHMPGPNEDHMESTTMASVQLRFDPLVKDAEPPKLGQLASKLRIGTFYSSSPRYRIPSGKSALSDRTQGIYVVVLNLSARCLSGTEWLKHDPHTPSSSAMLRRDSAMSMAMGSGAGCPAPSKSHNPDLPFYTAQVLVPISPPKNKILVPSFQSCLASRTYILEVSLTLPQASSITLKLPIQITSEGGTAPPPDFAEVADEVAELEAADSVDQYLTPRRISSPNDYSAQTSHRRVSPPRRQSAQVAPPPEYSAFAPRTGFAARSEAPSALYQALNMVR